MRIVVGSFNGTGAAVHIGCGFIPDEVTVYAPGDAGAVCPNLYWNRLMSVAAAAEGVLVEGDGTASVQAAAGAGISIEEGGVQLTSTLQTSVTYGEGVYLRRDEIRDYRYGPNLGPGGLSGDAVASTIDTWTLDTSGNRTGKFNEDVTGTYIGPGSPILIANDSDTERYWAFIEVLAAGEGEDDDEVTLNRAIASGKVSLIGGMYSFKPVPLGESTQAGFLLSATTLVNVNNELNMFKAIQW